MQDLTIAITGASFHGNKGAAAMLQSTIKQLHERYGSALNIRLLSTYPSADRKLSPYDFVKVVSCKPEELLFIAFPLAILYWLFQWCGPVKRQLRRYKVIRAFTESDLTVDESGVSFVDSRGLVMNVYAFVMTAVPMLLGIDVIKYSQALGEFHSPINRFLAKWILPKVKLICARGEITQANLAGIGITKNVVLCADGAFSMPDDEAIAEQVADILRNDPFYHGEVIAVSLSSVVAKKCEKNHIDYRRIMVDFINYLTAHNYSVLLIANAARLGSEKLRNNDLIICGEVYRETARKENIRWYNEEMPPEKIRELLSISKMLVASRFHAMIGGLYKQTPTLLVGWSHKYKEVLDMFGLSKYAVDFSQLKLETLIEQFQLVDANAQTIRQTIADRLPEVVESSRMNVELIAQYVDEHIFTKSKKNLLFDFGNPEKYIGKNIGCTKGYASAEEIRQKSASGGMVTALLCSLIRAGEIDGAWVTKSVVENGELKYKTFVATTAEEIHSCSSSIYMHMPLLKDIHIALDFPGKIAVVMLPCQIRALSLMMEKNRKLHDKIALKISLYCSGSHDKMATLLPLKKKKISLDHAKQFIFRQGHWRGMTLVIREDGSTQTMSYTKTLCAYKNAYFFVRKSCLYCQDHFGEASDLSFGDIWLKEMKKNPIKHTNCIIRTPEGKRLYDMAVRQGDLISTHVSQNQIIRSQKRALVFKFHCAQAKLDHLKKQGKELTLNTDHPARWNHRLAFALMYRNWEISEKKLGLLEKIPTQIIFYYMLFIRFLLNF